ncbi:hypothetical protein Hanom_Chr13g01204811 [Helianthus anomalus]
MCLKILLNFCIASLLPKSGHIPRLNLEMPSELPTAVTIPDQLSSKKNNKMGAKISSSNNRCDMIKLKSLI